MHKRALAVSALVGTGVAVVCVPEIMAYRRLGVIARSLRDGAWTDAAATEPAEGGAAGR
jgi:hypothetical protein